eukprot:TRINITY_DN6460_c0_g1_i1.p2 TRINITY_DN6460_c0_g1~~TRINITY_DN6460_c0_g1_i1.p2  ORF type:complete len:133 (+),score=18.08 TRINITY_DN6460_c0_g1_i1:3-401(+)
MYRPPQPGRGAGFAPRPPTGTRPRPAGDVKVPPPRPPAPTQTAPKPTPPSAKQEHNTVYVSPEALQAVSNLDRLRATMAIAGIGDADRQQHRAAAMKLAANSLRSGEAFRVSVYGDQVLEHLAATARESGPF